MSSCAPLSRELTGLRGDRCFEPKILTRLSKHYETGQPLDADFIDKILKRLALAAVVAARRHPLTEIIRSRYTNVGMFYLRQVSLATFDLRVHLSERKSDAVREFRRGVG